MSRAEAHNRNYTIVDLARFLRRSWHIIGAGALLGVILGGIGIWLTPVMYTAATILSPAQPAQQVRLGGLIPTALLGGGADSEALTERAVATLESREFLERFIRERGLAPEGDAGSFYRTMVGRIHLVHGSSRIMTLTVKWETPEGAAEVANALVDDVNRLMRDRAMEETTQLIAYLNARVGETNDMEMRRVIYSLIHDQMRTQMMAQAKDQYAFLVVDPAYSPNGPSHPRVPLLLIGGLMVGTILGVLTAGLLSVIRQARADN